MMRSLSLKIVVKKINQMKNLSIITLGILLITSILLTSCRNSSKDDNLSSDEIPIAGVYRNMECETTITLQNGGEATLEIGLLNPEYGRWSGTADNLNINFGEELKNLMMDSVEITESGLRLKYDGTFFKRD